MGLLYNTLSRCSCYTVFYKCLGSLFTAEFQFAKLLILASKSCTAHKMKICSSELGKTPCSRFIPATHHYICSPLTFIVIIEWCCQTVTNSHQNKRLLWSSWIPYWVHLSSAFNICTESKENNCISKLNWHPYFLLAEVIKCENEMSSTKYEMLTEAEMTGFIGPHQHQFPN